MYDHSFLNQAKLIEKNKKKENNINLKSNKFINKLEQLNQQQIKEKETETIIEIKRKLSNPRFIHIDLKIYNFISYSFSIQTL